MIRVASFFPIVCLSVFLLPAVSFAQAIQNPQGTSLTRPELGGVPREEINQLRSVPAMGNLGVKTVPIRPFASHSRLAVDLRPMTVRGWAVAADVAERTSRGNAGAETKAPPFVTRRDARSARVSFLMHARDTVGSASGSLGDEQ